MPYAKTTALAKIKATLYEDTFYKVIQGGMRAGKTVAILILLIGYLQSNKKKVVTVVGQSYGHLKDGAARDFEKIMQEHGYWQQPLWNKSELNYYFENGSVMRFRSVDNMLAHGIDNDVVFFNEANSYDYQTFKQVTDRTRRFVIVDFNPSSKFWAHEELLEKQPERTSFIVLTYKDNEALDEQIVKNIEANKPKKGEEPSNYWLVYGLGQIGSLEGNVYQGWIEKPKNKVIEKSRLIRYGLDFGFTNDETALVAVYERPEGSTGLVELYYKKGLLGSEYPEMLGSAGVDPNTLIVGDSARPEIIAEIKKAGYRIIPCDKGAGSIKAGIDRVQQQQIVYSGENIKKEFLTYHWRKRKDGTTLDEPIDDNNHLMDAIRYAISDLYKPRFDF